MTNTRRLLQFFPRAYPRPIGGFVYTTVRLGFTEPYLTVKDSMGWWLKQYNYGLYPCALQAASTTVLGWFLYSVRAIDLQVLSAAISENILIKVGLRWRAIAQTPPGTKKALQKPGDPIPEPVWAIHIEVETAKAELAKFRL